MRAGPGALARAVARLWFLRTTAQALKAALAAGLAWALGGLVPGAPAVPYLAPLTAMLTIQLTVAESVTGALQRTAGALVGVVVALVVSGSVGANAVTVAVLVLIAQLIGRALRLNAVSTAQVMTTALLVMTIGGATSSTYAVGRIVETIVGAVIGVAINAFLVPPTYLPAAVAAYEALADALLADLRDLSTSLARGLTPELAQQRLASAREDARRFEQTRQALQRAEDSLRMNLLGARHRADLDGYRQAVQTLEHTAIQVRSLSRSLADAVGMERPAWLDPTALGQPLADLVLAAAACLEAFVQARPDRPSACTSSAHACREAVIARARDGSDLLATDGWLKLGSIVATLDRLLMDIGSAAPDGPSNDELVD